MIHVTRLDGTDVVVNADLISTIERTPDTMQQAAAAGRSCTAGVGGCTGSVCRCRSRCCRSRDD